MPSTPISGKRSKMQEAVSQWQSFGPQFTGANNLLLVIPSSGYAFSQPCSQGGPHSLSVPYCHQVLQCMETDQDTKSVSDIPQWKNEKTFLVFSKKGIL